MTGSTDSSSSLTRTVTSQFSFNESDGTITLSNGKKFAVEIGSDSGFKKIGHDNKELIQLVTEMLDQIGQQEGIEYKDLSQTKISYDGVTTDQKEKPAKTYKLETHEQKYEQITQVAQRALSEFPKTPLSSKRLSVRPDARGNDPIDLTQPSEPVASTLPTSESSTNEARLSISADDQKASSASDQNEDDALLEVTVELTPPPVASRVSETVRFSPIGQADQIQSPKPNIREKISSKWNQFLDWLSSTRYAPRIFSNLTDRAAAREAKIRKHGLKIQQDKDETSHQLGLTVIELNEKPMIVVTLNSGSEQRFKSEEEFIASGISEDNIATKKTVSALDFTDLTLDQIDNIVADVKRFDGKIKLKKTATDGAYILRAGHRRHGKDQQVGISSRSHKGISGIADAVRNQHNVISRRTNALKEAKSLLDEVKIDRGKPHYIPSNLDTSLKAAKALDKLIESPALKNYIKCTEELKNDSENELKYTEFQTARKELASEIEQLNKVYQEAIIIEAKKIIGEIDKVESIYTNLLNSVWGEQVLEKSGTKDIFNSAYSMLRGYTKDDINRVIESFSVKESQMLPTWLSKDEFLDQVFNPENADFRMQFATQYRWIYSTEDYLSMLKTRFEDNENKLVSADPETDPQEINRLKGEQTSVLEMLEQWAITTKVSPEDKAVHQLFKDSDSDIVEGSAKQIHEILDSFLELGSDESSPNHEKMAEIQQALNTSTEINIPEPVNTDQSYLDTIEQLITGNVEGRDDLVSEFASDLSIMMTNAYLKIQASEVSNAAWEKEKTRPIAQNLSESIYLFNRVNQVCQYLVYTVPVDSNSSERRPTTSEEQARAIEFLMDVAMELVDQGDFNTAMAINSALNASGVFRLKNAWNKVDKKKSDEFNEKLKILDASGNFSKLRKHLRENPSHIPYTGRFLGDIITLKEMPLTRELEDGKEWNRQNLEHLSQATKGMLAAQKGKSPKATKSNIVKDFTSLEFDPSDAGLFSLSEKAQK